MSILSLGIFNARQLLPSISEVTATQSRVVSFQLTPKGLQFKMVGIPITDDIKVATSRFHLHTESLKINNPGKPQPKASVKNNIPTEWWRHVRARVGKCVHFGLNLGQAQRSTKILYLLASSAADMRAASEGYAVRGRRAFLMRKSIEPMVRCFSSA